jgi:hypothetical protein
MKKYLLIAALLMCGVAGHSQVLISLLLGDKLNSDWLEFGLEGGTNFSTIDGVASAEFIPRFNLGFYFDFKLKNPKLGVHTGVIVKSTMGAQGIDLYSLNDVALDSAFSGGSINRKIGYFNVPILLSYNFISNFSLQAGIMAGLRSKVSDNFEAKVKEKDDLNYMLDVKKQYHPIDVGGLVGVNYRFKEGGGMNLAVRYYFGFVDIVVDDSTPDQYNSSVYLTLGIPIGAGKKASAETSPASAN